MDVNLENEKDSHLIPTNVSLTRKAAVDRKPALTRRARTLAFVLGCLFTTTLYAAPQAGDTAPDFSLQGSDGNTHTLSDFRGRGVVIAFFPKAFTGG